MIPKYTQVVSKLDVTSAEPSKTKLKYAVKYLFILFT